jgi:hypothetical protein
MASSSPSEPEIQQRIRLARDRGPVRLWRNNACALVDPQGRFVRFGLCKGSSCSAPMKLAATGLDARQAAT